MLPPNKYQLDYLANEAGSLLVRLQQVKPFTMTMPMVRGAAVSDKALNAIMQLLENGKLELYHSIQAFIKLVGSKKNTPAEAQKFQVRYTLLKLRFNSILDQLDIFADVLSQRAEHEVGIWLSGLDILAEDGLIPGNPLFELPSLVVFLERGHGAAIRRARTRLPGGDLNPVAVIQIPRERMVGSGIASSLVHEVGHQGAALLDLITSLRIALKKKQDQSANKNAWLHFERWISEIICDFWATAQLGIAATLGLMGVVTLPAYFQFRLDLEDPHPAPYVRVQTSCAFGKRLFPHPQWDRLWAMWQNFYPLEGLPQEKLELLSELEQEMPDFVELVIQHTNPALQGNKLIDLFPVEERQPAVLQRLFRQWKQDPLLIPQAAPTLVFAVLGQAKSDLLIDAEEESRILTQQLRNWAYHRK